MAARLVVLASGGGRTLENLQNHILEGKLNARIELVIVSDAKLGALEKAEKLGLSVLVISKKSYPDRTQREHRLLGSILEARPDYVVLAGWLQLLPIPPELEGRVLNIHPALLPAFGGKGFYGQHVHQAVSAAQISLTGCTVHFATSQYDVGPIVLQAYVSIEPGADAGAIARAVFEKECQAYPEAIQSLIEGRAHWQAGEVTWS
ncbi:MAG: phosphoribosylglycinamide formyltransferase [Planctomycetota bacterium]|nr:phosphoribosylglycinamide formyltransferase [Planctomycetota bacterium]MDA1114729.1 phosphoribosylglycinamide formyltransferase [Planctomycetota bacterium]